MPRSILVLALGLSLTLAPLGCVGSRWTRGHAFVPPLRHYRVRYDDVAHRRVLPESWRVLNLDGGGIRPAAEWWTGTSIEVSEGTSRLLRHPRFDLYAEYGEDGSTLFVRTLPVPFRLAPRSLEVLAHQLVTSAMGEGFVFVADDPTHGTQVLSSQIVEEMPAEVGGVDAYYVTVQTSVLGATRVGSAVTFTLVLMRPREWRWRAEGLATHDGAPMLVVAGYEAAADCYASHVADFHALLSRLDVRPE